MQLPLAQKVWLSLVSTVFLAAMCSALVLLWAIHTAKDAERLLYENLQQETQINKLRVTLLEENNWVSLGLLKATSRWLDKFDGREDRFERVLDLVEKENWEPDQRALVVSIRRAYGDVKREQKESVALCRSESLPEARQRYEERVVPALQLVYGLCERLDSANNQDIKSYVNQRSVKTELVSIWMAISIILVTGLVSGLLFFFVQRFMEPLKRMTDEATRHSIPLDDQPARTELDSLRFYLDNLKDDVQKARSGLAQSHARLMDVEKLATVARLAAGVAHEIRSPLTSLKLRLFSMQKTVGESSRSRHDVKVMMEEVDRLDSIVQNFLDFSRPPEVRVERCSVTLLLDNTVELLKYKIDAANVRLECDAPSDIPSILADANQIKEVFINLLNNAIDAMPRGGVLQLAINTAKGPQEQSMVVVRFRDSGSGIPDDIRAEIFDPFFSTKKEGVGLGLWIAKQIMNQHKGLLDLEDSSSNGSVFAVWIPADPVGKS